MSGETAAPRLLPGRRIKLWRRRVTPVGRLLPAGTLRDDVGLERGERVSVPGGLGTQPREAEAPPRLRSRLPGSGPHDPSPAPPPAAALRLPGSGRHRARPLAAATGGGVCLQRDGVRRWAPLAIQLVQGTFTPRSSPLLLCPPLLQSGRPEYKSPQRTGVRGPQSRPVPYPDSSSSWRPYDPRRSTLLCVPLSTTTPWHPPCAPAESKVTSSRQIKASLVSKAAACRATTPRAETKTSHLSGRRHAGNLDLSPKTNSELPSSFGPAKSSCSSGPSKPGVIFLNLPPRHLLFHSHTGRETP